MLESRIPYCTQQRYPQIIGQKKCQNQGYLTVPNKDIHKLLDRRNVRIKDTLLYPTKISTNYWIVEVLETRIPYCTQQRYPQIIGQKKCQNQGYLTVPNNDIHKLLDRRNVRNKDTLLYPTKISTNYWIEEMLESRIPYCTQQRYPQIIGYKKCQNQGYLTVPNKDIHKLLDIRNVRIKDTLLYPTKISTNYWIEEMLESRIPYCTQQRYPQIIGQKKGQKQGYLTVPNNDIHKLLDRRAVRNKDTLLFPTTISTKY